ncbi:titin-like [Hyalella azteca]|uniref:Titin-like n=1 Tax=Hyalella azteca TaxID=294128 RepID=A0A8B7PKA4_HYAAZ|nr:titin-like [Hyalella azteca]
MYSEEISDHFSGQEGNQAELPPLRIVRETSRTGPLLMEAMVIDVENDAFDEYMSMSDQAYDDLRTEADVEELSVIEAVMVDEREVLRSDIVDMPDVAVEVVSPQIVEGDLKEIAQISEANIMAQNLRALSEQGLAMLQDDGQIHDEDFIGGRVAVKDHGEQMAENIQKKSKRPIDYVESAMSDTELASNADAGQESSETATLPDDGKSAKKSAKKRKKKESLIGSPDVQLSEVSTPVSPEYSNVVFVEKSAMDINDVPILEAAPSLKQLIIQNKFAEVLEASYIEAIIQQQVNLLCGTESQFFNLEDPQLQEAVLQQLTSAVLAQQVQYRETDEPLRIVGDSSHAGEEFCLDTAQQFGPFPTTQDTSGLFIGNYEETEIDSSDVMEQMLMNIATSSAEAVLAQDSGTELINQYVSVEENATLWMEPHPTVHTLQPEELEYQSSFETEDNEVKTAVSDIEQGADSNATVSEPPQLQTADENLLQGKTLAKKRQSEEQLPKASDATKGDTTVAKKVKVDESVGTKDKKYVDGKKTVKEDVKVRTNLSGTDISALQTAVNKLKLEKKPIEIEEMLSAGENKISVKSSKIRLSSDQQKNLENLDNFPVELQVLAQVQMELPEGKQLIHKVIGPRTAELANRLSECDVGDAFKSLPVIEITEIKAGPEVIKRKMKINKAKVIYMEDKCETIDEQSLREICTASAEEVLAEVSPKKGFFKKILPVKRKPIEVVVEGNVLVKDEVPECDTSQLVHEASEEKPSARIEAKQAACESDADDSVAKHISDKISVNETSVIAEPMGIAGVYEKLGKELPEPVKELSDDDLRSLTAVLQQIIAVERPVELVEKTTPHGEVFEICEGNVEISKDNFEVLQSLVNPAEDLGIAIEITETLDDERLIIHKVISPKNERLLEKLIAESSKAEIAMIPVFEITEEIDKGKTVKKTVKVNEAKVVLGDAQHASLEGAGLLTSCQTAISEVIPHKNELCKAVVSTVHGDVVQEVTRGLDSIDAAEPKSRIEIGQQDDVIAESKDVDEKQSNIQEFSEKSVTELKPLVEAEPKSRIIEEPQDFYKEEEKFASGNDVKSPLAQEAAPMTEREVLLPSGQEATPSLGQEATSPPVQKAVFPFTQEITSLPGQEAVPPPIQETAPTPAQEAVSLPRQEAVPPPRQEAVLPPREESVSLIGQEEVPPPRQAAVSPLPEQETVIMPRQEAVSSPGEEGVSAPGQEVVPPPGQEVVPPPGQEVVHPPRQEVAIPLRQEVVIPLGQEVVIPLGHELVIPPGQEVVIPPGQEVVIPPGQEVAISPGQDAVLSRGQKVVSPSVLEALPPGKEAVSPPRKEAASITRQEAASAPGQEAVSSPGQEEVYLSGQNAVSLPGHKSLTSSGKEERFSSGQDVALAPGQVEISPPGKEGVSSPSQTALSPPEQEEVSPPGQKAVSPPGQIAASPPEQESVTPLGREEISPLEQVNELPPRQESEAPPRQESVHPLGQEAAPPPVQEAEFPSRHEATSSPRQEAVSPSGHEAEFAASQEAASSTRQEAGSSLEQKAVPPPGQEAVSPSVAEAAPLPGQKP